MTVLDFVSSVPSTTVRKMKRTSDSDSTCGNIEPWPLVNGLSWDGKDLIQMLRDGCSPLSSYFDARYLISEIESQLDVIVRDIPLVRGEETFYV